MEHVIDELLVEAEEEEEPTPQPARAAGKSTEPWDELDPTVQSFIRYIANAARRRQMVRIRYRPKVTTGTAVYRTVQPYSLRWRDVHVDGYDAPPVRTVVFFGFDPFKGTIKMFVVDRIRSIEATGRSYEPSHPVEFESKIQKVIDDLLELTEPEQDIAVDQMVQKYEAQPTNLWLYSDLPVKDMMALAYLTADNMMGAPYKGDKVRQFAAALKMTTAEPEGFWEQIRAKDPVRAEYLDKLEWSLERVPLEDIGVYPHFGGFPVEWSKGNVPETAAALVAGTENPERRADVFDIASQYATVIKFLPPVLIPGTHLRDPKQGYKQTKWTIDDGNHRLIGASIAGAKDAICFVGRRKEAEEAVKDYSYGIGQRMSYWIGPSGKWYEGDPNAFEHFDDPPWLAKHATTKIDREAARKAGRKTDRLKIMVREGYVKIDMFGRTRPGRVQFSIESLKPTREILHTSQTFLMDNNVTGGTYFWHVQDEGIYATGRLEDFLVANDPTDLRRTSRRTFGGDQVGPTDEYGMPVREDLSQVKYKVFLRAVFESAGIAFLEEMQEADGDPQADAERRVEDVTEITWIAGIPEEDAVDYAQLVSEQFGLTYDYDDDSITVRWSQLPQEYKQWARHVASTPLPAESLDEQDFDQLDLGPELPVTTKGTVTRKVYFAAIMIPVGTSWVARRKDYGPQPRGEMGVNYFTDFVLPDGGEYTRCLNQMSYNLLVQASTTMEPVEDLDEITTSGAAGSYEVPLGAQPYWKKKKKKKKKVEQAIDNLLSQDMRNDS